MSAPPPDDEPRGDSTNTPQLEGSPSPVDDRPRTVALETASGVLWMTGQKWTVRVFGIFTIALLTRILSPEDFGVVAAALTVLPFFNLLADLGFAAYIVQVRQTDQRMLSTGFWFSATAGVALCLALVGLAPLLGLLFQDSRITPVLQVLSIAVVFTGISSVPMALLRRGMRFRTIAWQGASAALVAQVVAVAMALSGYGVWALVGQSIVLPAVVMLLAVATVGWRPSYMFSRPQFAAMARYGTKVLGVEFVAMTRAWAEAAIVSATLGMAGLGYLNIAQRLVAVVQDLTGAALAPVATVSFARIREEKARLRRGYLRAVRMTYAVMSPPLTFLAVAAPLIIPLVFGTGWEASHRVAQVLALAGILTVSAALDHGLFYGLGRPGRWFLYAVIVDACTLGTTALTVRYGLEAIAYGFLGVALAATVARWFLVAPVLETKALAVAGPFRFLTVAVIASGTAGLAAMALTHTLAVLAQIVLVGTAVLLAYLVVAFVMAKSVMVEIRRYLGHRGAGGVRS